jgi:peptidoglycan/xylan/chitin deacetylase (PgdA/CDA1 family)
MTMTRFTLSVDDGHPLDLRMAELLDRHDLDATFYVPMSNCEGPPVMTAPQLRSLSSRFELGSHTAEHRFLTGLGRAAAWRQIRDGKAELEDVLGQRVNGFCYPGGHYRREHVALVRAAGFTHARTTQNLRTDAGTRPFELPTSVQFYPHPRRVLFRNFVSQAHWQRRRPALLAAWTAHDWLDRLYALFSHACRKRAVFHLWLHTADVDALQLWTVLDEFLGCVARRVPRAHRLTNGEWFTQEFPTLE